MSRDLTQQAVIDEFFPKVGLQVIDLTGKPIEPSTYIKEVDKKGVYIGNHGPERRGPYHDAKRPLGVYQRLQKDKSYTFAVFARNISSKEGHQTKKNSERPARLHEGAVDFLLRAATIELLRNPSSEVLQNNIEQLLAAHNDFEPMRQKREAQACKSSKGEILAL